MRNFTVEADLEATGILNSSSDTDLLPIVGSVVFTPQFRGIFKNLNMPPRPKGFSLRRRNAILDETGRLMEVGATEYGVRLPANDPAYGISGLTYRVDFDCTAGGFPVHLDSVYVPAPDTDTTLPLSAYMKDAENLALSVRPKVYVEDIVDIDSFTEALGVVGDFDPRLDDHRVPVDGSVTLASLDAGLASELGVRGSTSTVTSSGTTTLTVASQWRQIFTGSQPHTVKLPTTSIVAGGDYEIINQSSGTLAVQSSNGDLILLLGPNRIGAFEAVVDTPTAVGHWSFIAPTAVGYANTVALRDQHGNLYSTGFVSEKSSTVTAAGTTTLTVDSPQVQIFTGTTTQTCQLPTTGVVAGQKWTVINQSSLYDGVTVNSSDGTLVSTVRGGANRVGEFIALVDTPTAGSHWWPVAVNTSATALTVAMRDLQNKILANSFVLIPQQTTTSGGTLTLGIQDGQTRTFVGSSNHTVKLPSNGILAGWINTVINQSSGTITVQSSGANTITTVAASSAKRFMALIDAPTTDVHWQVL